MNVGEMAEAELTVEQRDSAEMLALDSRDSFPAVLATSRMVALMEIAAARLLSASLQPGEHSVGVTVAVRHVAATPIGGRVRARATYLGADGKLFRFKVEAFDDAGLIGDGEHSRAIVATSRLLGGAAKRVRAAT